MYKIPSEFLYELHHPRPRFKKNRENVFGNMAFSIAELDGKPITTFKDEIDIAIRNISGNEDIVQKTVDNWRTEITTLFSMKQELNGKVYATDLTKELANSTNLTRFFLRAMITFQYPGGFLKSHEIKKIVEAKILFNPLLWLSKFFTLNDISSEFYITELEFCHCVLNDMRVTSIHEDISLTYNRISMNRRDNVYYNTNSDTKRSAGDILDYCVLAGVLYRGKGKTYLVKKDALPLLNFFKNNYKLFTSYTNTTELSEITNLRNLWINFVNVVSEDILISFSDENVDVIDNTNLEDLEIDNVSLDYKQLNYQSLKKLSVQISNKDIGNKGELLALIHEKLFLINGGYNKLFKRVKQIPDKYAVGYDILSRNYDATMKQIEVKTTNSEYDVIIHRIHLTDNEWSAAESHGTRYFIYRISLSGEKIKLWIIHNPYDLYKKNMIRVYEREGVDLTFNSACYEEVDLLRYHE